MAAAVLGLIGYAVKYNPSIGIATNPDSIHQLATLSWLQHSLLQRGIDVRDIPFFYPTPGFLAGSEVPWFQGGVFTIFRALGMGALLSWNVLYALITLGNLSVSYWVLRRERFSAEASVVGALVFASTNLWLVFIHNGIWYRTTFGLPLAWHLGKTIIDSPSRGSRYPLYLSLILVLQYLSCATAAVVALLTVLGLLVHKWPPTNSRRAILMAVLPTTALALTTQWWLGARLPAKEISTFTESVQQQTDYRLDLANLLPAQINGFSAFHADRQDSVSGTLSNYWVFVVPFALLIVPFLNRVPWQDEKPVDRTGLLIAALIICLSSLAGFAGTLDHFPEHHLRIGIGTVFEVGIVLVALHLISRLDEVSGRLYFLIFVSFLLALGPFIYVWGTPVAAGPLSGIELMVHGLAHQKISARYLLLMAFPTAWAVAMGSERIIEKYPSARRLVASAVAIIFLLTPGGAVWAWPLPSARGFPMQEDPAVCPNCTEADLTALPLPYQYLLARNDVTALLELPAGQNEGNRKLGIAGVVHDSVYQFYQVMDGIPRITGASSTVPKSYLGFIDSLSAFPDSAVISAIRQRGAKWVLVHGDRYPPGDWARLQKALDPPPPGLTLEKKWGTVWLYRVD